MNNLGTIIFQIYILLNEIIPVLILLGVVYFVWGVVTYVIGNDEEAKTRGRDRIIYGIIGFGVIVGMWGLVYILVNTFNLGYVPAPAVSITTTNTADSGNTSLGTCSGTGIGKIICQVGLLLNAVIPVLIMLGVVYFIWGVVQYVIADGEEAKTKGKDTMIFGIIGFAVIAGLWGLVNLLINTFSLGGASAPSGININGSSSTCTLGTNPQIQNLLGYVTCIINNSIIPLIFSVAVVSFVWGVLQFFIINADEEAKREQGRQFMLWGIVAIAVMLSVWGLVAIFGNTFGISGSILPHVTPPGS